MPRPGQSSTIKQAQMAGFLAAILAAAAQSQAATTAASKGVEPEGSEATAAEADQDAPGSTADAEPG